MSWIRKTVQRPKPGLSKSEAYGHFNFDFRGMRKDTLSLFHPVRAKRVKDLEEQSQLDANTIIYQGNCDDVHAHSAVFHALWMYRITREFGPVLAKDFGDSYELTHRTEDEFAERLLDLYNNWMGRVLASDHENVPRNDMEVIQEALNSGILQTTLDPAYSKERLLTEEEILRSKIFSFNFVEKPKTYNASLILK
ncbi:uncharacterized protein [Ptychodera flava]|uniref:uncharacterized protein n=1 Tax=Ptychodera flava TaxID=63121 RepID=UPI003969FF08